MGEARSKATSGRLLVVGRWYGVFAVASLQTSSARSYMKFTLWWVMTQPLGLPVVPEV